jgi:hypothetical protein
MEATGIESQIKQNEKATLYKVDIYFITYFLSFIRKLLQTNGNHIFQPQTVVYALTGLRSL